MTKVKSAPSATKVKKPKIARPGVHAKSKTSKLKSSKNYKKLYKGQGQYDRTITAIKRSKRSYRGFC